MPKIELETFINADIEICFDVSRSIDLHQISTFKTNEKAIAGRTSGLIEMGEFVTWEATHFGIRQKLTSKITAFEKPFHFCDEMEKGIFKSIKHDHYFSNSENGVVMKDVFIYQTPLGFIGKIVERIILTNYLKKFLIERNQIIKNYAESGLYKSIF